MVTPRCPTYLKSQPKIVDGLVEAYKSESPWKDYNVPGTEERQTTTTLASICIQATNYYSQSEAVRKSGDPPSLQDSDR
jgi:hypothetical protein